MTAMRILITGAAGNLGTKLAHALRGDGHDVTGLDQRAAPSGGWHQADIAHWGGWSRHFDGSKAVIHLAGEMRPTASWAEVHGPNITGTANVLRAARQAGVRRVILASTNQVMAGYRCRTGPITETMPPAPLNPYAISKYLGEEMGRAFHAETGIAVIAFRIGNIMPEENIPAPGMGLGLWGQEMWLSNRDFTDACRAALICADPGFAVLNLVSNNAGMRWTMQRARDAIGFVPRDSHRPAANDADRAADRAARAARLVPGWWLDQNFGQIPG